MKGLWWKSMWLIDANVILRYLLGDNEEMQSTSLDFVDCILIGRNKVKGEKIFSFDKKLNNKLDY